MLFVVVCICTIGEIHCAGKGIYGLHAIIAEMVQQQTENINTTIFDGNYAFRNLYQVSRNCSQVFITSSIWSAASIKYRGERPGRSHHMVVS